MDSLPGVLAGNALSMASRERALLSELHRRNQQVQQLGMDLSNELLGDTKRWDISAR